MSEGDMVRLREMLLKRRREIFEGLRRFESDWQALAERDIDLEELEISYRKGVIYLEGVVPSKHEHSILLQILADGMGLTSMVDHIGTNESVEVISRLVPGRLAKPLQ